MVEGMSVCGDCRRLANAPAFSQSEMIALLSRFEVVSLPARSRSWKKPRISACERRSPSEGVWEGALPRLLRDLE
jgi:hypothetical protein